MSEESFSPDWLALREPADHRARAADLVAPLVEWLEPRQSRRVLDLGSGTGSNLRYLAPRLRGEQEWTLVDRDADLLDRATGAAVTVPGVARVERIPGELDREGLGLVPGSDLVTASALLDLVTYEWLERLAATCRRQGAQRCLRSHGTARSTGLTLTATTSSSQQQFEATSSATNTWGRRSDQRPDRVPSAPFRAAGYDTWLRPSPWRLQAADASLARALVDGWEAAAAEQRPADASLIRDWAQNRRATVASQFALEVGHVDLLALPPGPGAP